MVKLRALMKLFWVVLQYRFGRPESEITLSLSTAEADVLLETAAKHGWRALIVSLLEARDAR